MLDFPASPSVNDAYTYGGKTWVWNGTAWAPTGSQGPVGDKGPTGDKGPVGDKGPTGDPGPAGAVAWGDITSKPDVFPPGEHTHGAQTKTVGGQSIWGSGDIEVGGAGGGDATSITYGDTTVAAALDAHGQILRANYGPPEALAALNTADFGTWIAQPGHAALFAQYADAPLGLSQVVDDSVRMQRVVVSSAAMNAVISSRTALRAVAAVPEAWAAFTASTALTVSMVPQMTSATAPSGVVTRSTEYSAAYAAWKVFDRGGGYWAAAAIGDPYPRWIAYQFTAPRFVHTVELTPAGEGAPTGFAIEHSDDGASWVRALTVPSYTGANNVLTTHPVVSAGRHKHWRLLITSGTGFSSVRELQFKGFV